MCTVVVEDQEVARLAQASRIEQAVLFNQGNLIAFDIRGLKASSHEPPTHPSNQPTNSSSPTILQAEARAPKTQTADSTHFCLSLNSKGKIAPQIRESVLVRKDPRVHSVALIPKH